MPSKDTTVKFKADISQLKSEMQAAQRQIKLVNSEFKAATAGMEDFTKSEEGLTAKTKQLTDVLDAQKKKLALMHEELEKTVAVYGEHSAAADRVRISINNQQAAISNTERELAGYNQQLEELPKELDDVSDASDKAADGFSVMKAALADLIADGIRTAISALKDFAQEAIQVGMDFESSMSNVQAISGATAEEMQQLNDKAKEMGETTKFSASESADAFSYMAMAGWKTEDMLEGIEGVMNLAAASGADLATTSDIVTDALTAMGYEAKDAGRLADVMAAASANANTNVELMGSTFKYVAPVVGALGYDMEDTAVAIGMMANAGIKGDKAGTALRSTLNRLSAPPKECAEEMEKLGISLTDGEGNMKTLMQVMEELRDAFSGLSETEQTAAAKHIAGQEAMSGLLAIVNGSEKDFEKLSNAITNSNGAAAEMADTMNNNVSGKLTLLQSKVEGIMIRLFERASDSMKRGIETVGDALDKVNWDKVGDDVGKFAEKAANFFSYIITNSSTIITILKTIGALFATVFVANKIASTATAVGTLITAFKSAGSVTSALTLVMEGLGISMSALPIMAVIAAIGALIVAAKAGNEQMEANAQAVYGLTEKENALIDSINETASATTAALQTRKDACDQIDVESSMLSSLKDRYNELIDENGNVKSGSEELAQTLLGELANGLGTTIENVKENIDANGKLGESIDQLIEKKKQEAKFTALEEEYKKSVQEEIDAFNQLKSAKEAQNEAQDKVTEAEQRYKEAVENTQKVYVNGFAGAKAIGELRQAEKDLSAAKDTLSELSGATQTASENWAQAQSTITYYQDALSASTENNAQKMNDALLSWQHGLVDSSMASKQQLEQQVLTTQQSLDQIKEMYSQGLVDDKVVSDYQRVFELAGQELDEWVDKNEASGREATDRLNGTASEGLVKLQGTIEQMSRSGYDALNTNLGDWGEVGEEKTGDFLGILEGKQGDFKETAEADAQAAADGLVNKASEFEKGAMQGADYFTKQLESKKGDFSNAGKFIVDETASGAEGESSVMETPGLNSADAFNKAIESKKGESNSAGSAIAKEAATGMDSEKGSAETSGNNFVDGFINAIKNSLHRAFEIGREFAKSALGGLKKGQDEGSPSKLTAKSGVFFAEGFAIGIKKTTKKVVSSAMKMTKDAIDTVKKTQQEGSPSKLTYESGRNFTQGFINGIASLEGNLIDTTKNLVNKTLAELMKINDFNFSETSSNASSLFSSGFQKQYDYMSNRISYENQQALKDFENTITQLQEEQAKKLETLSSGSTINQSVLSAQSELRIMQLKSDSEAKQLQISNYYNNQIKLLEGELQEKEGNYNVKIDELNEKLSKEQAKGSKKQNKKTIENLKAQIETYKKYLENLNAEYKSAISTQEAYRESELNAEKKSLENALNNEKNVLEANLTDEKAAIEKNTELITQDYERRIKEQQEMKEAYQQASSSMMSEFTSAMNSYYKAAQNLIDSTIQGISDKYNKQYDQLTNKQDNLINKLKKAGDLYNLSGANVMTINDVKAQTAAIKRYTSKLSEIKKKVSSDLFDEIASYDIKEGEAFIDRLLNMTDKELKAYSDAYDEKMSVSESLSKNLYKSDFDKIASGYKNDMQQAFKTLPDELEKLGWESMQGFLNGLTGNTDYMTQSVKTFIAGMVDTFKQQLGIHSPSKVAMGLGELVGEGFADGMLEMVNTVKAAAKTITDTVTTSLDFEDTLSDAKGVLYQSVGASGYNRNMGGFSGDKTQIINFNQYNNSPKALDRLSIYRDTNNILFSAKVGLSNV